MKNWKEIAKGIYSKNVTHKHDGEGRLQAMKEFAELACKEQKKICADNIELRQYSLIYERWLEDEEISEHFEEDIEERVDINSILNAPTVKFE